MPKGIQIPFVDPNDPGQLPAQAEPGSKIIFVDIGDFKVKTRDENGVDEVLGGSGTEFLHNPVVTNGAHPAASPYIASFNETVKVNPLGVTGVGVRLPNPSGNAGKRINVVNVTSTENEDAPAGSDDVITVTPAAGQINGSSNDVLTTQYESRIYESDGNNYIIVS